MLRVGRVSRGFVSVVNDKRMKGGIFPINLPDGINGKNEETTDFIRVPPILFRSKILY